MAVGTVNAHGRVEDFNNHIVNIGFYGVGEVEARFEGRFVGISLRELELVVAIRAEDRIDDVDHRLQ